MNFLNLCVNLGTKAISNKSKQALTGLHLDFLIKAFKEEVINLLFTPLAFYNICISITIMNNVKYIISKSIFVIIFKSVWSKG